MEKKCKKKNILRMEILVSLGLSSYISFIEFKSSGACSTSSFMLLFLAYLILFNVIKTREMLNKLEIEKLQEECVPPRKLILNYEFIMERS